MTVCDLSLSHLVITLRSYWKRCEWGLKHLGRDPRKLLVAAGSCCLRPPSLFTILYFSWTQTIHLRCSKCDHVRPLCACGFTLQLGYFCPLPSRAASVQAWETPWVKQLWTLLTSSPPRRPAERLNNYWGVRSSAQTRKRKNLWWQTWCRKRLRFNLTLTEIYSHFSDSSSFSSVFCIRASVKISADSHYPLFSRCFSCDASTRTKGLLQQLRPHKPQR